MAFSEPWSVTEQRRRQAGESFPVLNGTDAGTAIQMDDWGVPQGKPVSDFSQQTMNIAAFAGQMDGFDASEPDTAPNVEPWVADRGPDTTLTPDVSPNAEPWSKPAQPSWTQVANGQGFDYFNKQDVVNAPVGAGENSPFAPALDTLRTIGGGISNLLGGELPEALRPDSGASFRQQELASRDVIMQAIANTNIPAGGGSLYGAAGDVAEALNPSRIPKAEFGRAGAAEDLINPERARGDYVLRDDIQPVSDILEANGRNSYVRRGESRAFGGYGASAADDLRNQQNVDAYLRAWHGDDAIDQLREYQRNALATETFQGQRIERNARALARSGKRPSGVPDSEWAATQARAEELLLEAGDPSRVQRYYDWLENGEETVPISGESPRIGGGAANDFTPDDLNALIRAKRALGMTDEAIAADPDILAYQGRLFANAAPDAETFYRQPENLGGGQTLTPEVQAGIDRTVEMAGGRNTITNALENARGVSAQQQRMDALGAELDALVRSGRNTPADIDRKNELELLLGLREPRPGEGARVSSAGRAELGKPWPTKAPHPTTGWEEPASSVTLKNGRDVTVESYGDAVGRGYSGGFAMRDGETGQRMGYIEYQSHPDVPDVTIAMVKTEPQFQRQGVADTLLQRLMTEFPGRRIDPGMVTPQGDAWVRSLRRRGVEIGRAKGRTRIEAPMSAAERAAFNERYGLTDESSALDRVIARNADELPEPTRTVPQNLADIRARAQRIARGEEPGIGGGADIPGGEQPFMRPDATEWPGDGSLDGGGNVFRPTGIGEVPESGRASVPAWIPRAGITNTAGAVVGGVAGAAQPADSPEERALHIAQGAFTGLAASSIARTGIGRVNELQQARSIGARQLGLGEVAGAPRSLVQKGKDLASDVFKVFSPTEMANVLRTTASSYDLSGTLRQGGFLGPRHAKELKSMFGAQVRAIGRGGEEAAQNIQREIEQSPMAKYRRSMYMSDWAGTNLDKREEAFMSSLAGDVPGVYRSGRGYAVALNKYRADIFDSIVSQWPEAARTPERTKLLQDYIEAASGRGHLPEALQGLAKLFNGLYFSPRFIWSIPERHMYALTSDPLVRKEVLKDLGAFYGTGLTLLGAAAAAKVAYHLTDKQLKVTTNYEDPDWGKAVVGGKTRIDFWGGNQQAARMMLRVATATPSYAKAVLNGDLSQVKSSDNPLAIMAQFLRYKYSPNANLFEELRTGKTAVGEKVPALPVNLINKAAPMLLNDIYEAYAGWKKAAGEGAGAVAGGLAGIGSGLGVGVSTYEDSSSGGGARPKRPTRPVRPTRPTRSTR